MNGPGLSDEAGQGPSFKGRSAPYVDEILIPGFKVLSRLRSPHDSPRHPCARAFAAVARGHAQNSHTLPVMPCFAIQAMLRARAPLLLSREAEGLTACGGANAITLLDATSRGAAGTGD